jgi:hypothetical protein
MGRRRRDDVARTHREVEDCWVLGPDGRRPGVVMAWRYTRDGWLAQVVHTALVSGRWELVEEWLPESLVEVA